ncbi:urease accessory protein UreD [Thalassospira profundimaris]|uniref:Urease accessory protein UreD n=1 Tax=Thalassospira profundimaris TaxID=502049 RepID=A0A367XN83_9PROT|nr:urease accessory protein UreD [Thalassospira profundimaris]RCK54281.1 urease accessory protein UreD [Thalassospira profundimaris]
MQLGKIENSVRNDAAMPASLRPIVTDGRAEVAFKAAPVSHMPSSLDHLYYRDPMKMLFPRPQPGDISQAVLATTSGGMVGGDQLSFAGRTGENARLLITAQAAEKVYRSLGPDGKMQVALVADNHSWLEWLPQETILFDGARLRRTTSVSVSGSGRVLAGEMMVFGRLARGEVFTRGLARDAWDVSLDGRPVWRDALHLDGDILSVLDHPACFNGARASATAVFVGRGAEETLVTARECLEGAVQQGDGVLAAATAMANIVIVRWLAVEPMRLRSAYGTWWAAFRHRVNNLPARLPRMWEI